MVGYQHAGFGVDRAEYIEARLQRAGKQLLSRRAGVSGNGNVHPLEQGAPRHEAARVHKGALDCLVQDRRGGLPQVDDRVDALFEGQGVQQ